MHIYSFANCMSHELFPFVFLKKPPHLYGQLETELLYKMEEASIGVMEWRRGSPYEEASCKTK